MKKLAFIIAATLLASACSKSATGNGQMPKVCEDYLNETKAMMEQYPQLAAMFDKSLEDAKKNWGEMPTEQQEKLEKMCSEGAEQLAKVKEMQAAG